MASNRHTAPRVAVCAAILTAAAAAIIAAAGCGPVTMDAPQNPPSIPSRTAAAPPGAAAFDPDGFIAFIAPQGLFTVMVSARWTRVDDATVTTFTDQVGTIRIEQQPAAVPPSPETVRLHDLPVLAHANANANANANYLTAAVTVVDRRAGPAVLTTYRTAAPPSLVDPKASVDAVQRYQFWRNGHEATLTLSGPADADTTTLWRTITDSLHWL